MSFFPVDRGIFTSSVWLVGTSEEKVLWIWLLGNRDDDGVIRHREVAIAYGSGLARPTVEEILQKFSEPDPDSRTKDNDGRRIDRTEDGFVRILNHERYYSKDYSTPRWRRWKDRNKGLNGYESVGQQLEKLENVGPTKDKEKDKYKDSTEVRKEADPPALPPADRVERSIKASTDALRTRLYALVSEMEREDPEHNDPTELMRLVTAYDKADGTRVRGVVNAHLLSHERLERSIADAEALLAEWRAASGKAKG